LLSSGLTDLANCISFAEAESRDVDVVVVLLLSVEVLLLGELIDCHQNSLKLAEVTYCQSSVLLMCSSRAYWQNKSNLEHSATERAFHYPLSVYLE
jgi:hypothetical protein